MPAPPQPAEPRAHEPAPAVPPGPLDFDVYCLTCGYNLRGLYGDPVRCPECGNLNPVGDAEIPAPLVTARLRQMETVPALCIGALLVAGLFQPVFWSVLLEGVPLSDLWCVMVPAFGPLLGWFAGVLQFRQSCFGQPGWAKLLVLYHACGLGASSLIAAAMVLVIMAYGPAGRGFRVSFFLWLGLVFVASLFFVRRVLKGWHARLMERVHDLQRPVATTILREETRHRMRR